MFHLIGIMPNPQQQLKEHQLNSTKARRKYIAKPSDVSFDEILPETWEIIYDLEDECARQRNFECERLLPFRACYGNKSGVILLLLLNLSHKLFILPFMSRRISTRR